jgi:cell division protein ZipA
MLTLYLILLAIAGLGIFALALIISSFRKPPVQKNTYSQSTAFSNADEDELEEVEVLAQQKKNTRSGSMTSDKMLNDPTLASLGFSALDTVLDEPEPILRATAVTATSSLAPQQPTQPDYHPEHKSVVPTKNIIVFYVLAMPNRPFVGYELSQALFAADLRFGEKRIFHRYEQAEGEGQILFSVASAVEPGIFDLADIGGFSCPGLCLFMSPNKVADPAAVFELMLETAEQLTEDLDGQLCNENRELLQDEEIEDYRAGF